MAENNRVVDPIPENFESIAQAAEFWDTHDLGDYWEETQEVKFDVRLPHRRTIALATHLAERIADQAEQEGVSVETLVNLWLSERIQLST